MTLCLIAFVFYRAESLHQSLWILKAMFGSGGILSDFRLPDGDLLIALLVTECLVVAHWLCRRNSLEALAGRVPWWSVSVALALMVLAITLSSSESQGFLYFQY
jgi:hypothetical protein